MTECCSLDYLGLGPGYYDVRVAKRVFELSCLSPLVAFFGFATLVMVSICGGCKARAHITE